MRLTGTKAEDLLHGTYLDDNIDGRAGNDTITGENGSDNINGSTGADFLYGDAPVSYSPFLLPGIAGNDTLDGGAGDDNLNGGEGRDLLYGRGDADWLYGEGGSDTLDGGDGADYLNDDDGDDLLIGGAGGDMLAGGTGSDTYRGGVGDDNYNEPDSEYYNVPYYTVPASDLTVPLDEPVSATVLTERDVFVFEATKGAGGFGHDRVSGFDPGQDQLRFIGYTEVDLAQPAQALVTEGYTYTYTDYYDPSYSYTYTVPDHVDWQFDFKDGSRVLVSFYDEAGVASNSTGPVAGQDYAFT
jgi:Ca2+-binding RTX toxin-like protein